MKCKVLTQIKHSGKIIGAGEEVELSAAAAKELIVIRAVTLVEADKSAKKVTA